MSTSCCKAVPGFERMQEGKSDAVSSSLLSQAGWNDVSTSSALHSPFWHEPELPCAPGMLGLTTAQAQQSPMHDRYHMSSLTRTQHLVAVLTCWRL